MAKDSSSNRSSSREETLSGGDSASGLDRNAGNQPSDSRNFKIPNAKGLKRSGKLMSKAKSRNLNRR